MKLLSVLFFFISLDIFACLGQPNFVEIDKIKKEATIKGDHFIFRSTVVVEKWETESNIKMVEKKHTKTLGGLHLYVLTRNVSNAINGKLAAFLDSKKITIHYDIQEQTRGCGGKAVIVYR